MFTVRSIGSEETQRKKSQDVKGYNLKYDRHANTRLALRSIREGRLHYINHKCMYMGESDFSPHIKFMTQALKINPHFSFLAQHHIRQIIRSLSCFTLQSLYRGSKHKYFFTEALTLSMSVKQHRIKLQEIKHSSDHGNEFL